MNGMGYSYQAEFTDDCQPGQGHQDGQDITQAEKPGEDPAWPGGKIIPPGVLPPDGARLSKQPNRPANTSRSRPRCPSAVPPCWSTRHNRRRSYPGTARLPGEPGRSWPVRPIFCVAADWKRKSIKSGSTRLASNARLAMPTFTPGVKISIPA